MNAATVALAIGIPTVMLEDELGDLVGSADNASEAIHRWYPFKESFSHQLPTLICKWLKPENGGVALDVFAGVGTTALAFDASSFDSAIGVEYSPFAHFVGQAKLAWSSLDPEEVAGQIPRALGYRVKGDLQPPGLSSFSNEAIFAPDRLQALLSARRHLLAIDLSEAQRDFFMLGLAAVIEESSGAIKDGRALRILNGRRRASKLLRPDRQLEPCDDFVRDALAQQWWGMQEDIAALAHSSGERNTALHHLRGDARQLAEVKFASGKRALEPASVRLSIFSPPYLNCIDYSEIYKLEIWLLEMVGDREAFRELRRGTLRSHPSIEFPNRGYLAAAEGSWVALVETISTFVERNGARAHIGEMIRNYFGDMYRVFAQQLWVLEPGAWMVCVVGNSTFSRRIQNGDGREEQWRIPLLTDVILARMAESLGFVDVQIWSARELRARNVRNGKARESAVVARKPA